MTKRYPTCLAIAVNSLLLLGLSCTAFSAEAAVSTSGSILKMIMGLVAVLALMAIITWVLKRMLPGAGGQQSVARVVGGVSVGSRERVVVVEIGNRWLVVGVAPGHVSSIAEMEISLDSGDAQLVKTLKSVGGNALYQQPVNSFATWLKQSTAKFSSNSSAKPTSAKPSSENK